VSYTKRALDDLFTPEKLRKNWLAHKETAAISQDSEGKKGDIDRDIQRLARHIDGTFENEQASVLHNYLKEISLLMHMSADPNSSEALAAMIDEMEDLVLAFDRATEGWRELP